MLEVFDGIPGWYRHEPFFKEMVRRAPDVGRFVEVGVLFGAASNGIAKLIRESGKSIDLYMVDTFNLEKLGPEGKAMVAKCGLGGFRETFDYFRKGAAHNHPSCHVIVGGSIKSAPTFEDKSVDLVFLDTLHTEEHVTNELIAWLPKIRSGGYLGVKAGSVHNGSFVDLPEAGIALKKVYPNREIFDEIVSYVRGK